MTKEQIELIAKFDNWLDMHNVVTTFNIMGMPYSGGQEQYLEDITNLTKARAKYPQLPLYEAYDYFTKNPDSILIIPPNKEDILLGQSRGLGDTIAKITHATGLDKLAHLYTSITGKDCGCSSRQEALNKLIPYGVKEDGV